MSCCPNTQRDRGDHRAIDNAVFGAMSSITDGIRSTDSVLVQPRARFRRARYATATDYTGGFNGQTWQRGRRHPPTTPSAASTPPTLPTAGAHLDGQPRRPDERHAG